MRHRREKGVPTKSRKSEKSRYTRVDDFWCSRSAWKTSELSWINLRCIDWRARWKQTRPAFGSWKTSLYCVIQTGLKYCLCVYFLWILFLYSSDNHWTLLRGGVHSSSLSYPFTVGLYHHSRPYHPPMSSPSDTGNPILLYLFYFTTHLLDSGRTYCPIWHPRLSFPYVRVSWFHHLNNPYLLR